jgi:predicted RND superfamily exporter protein
MPSRVLQLFGIRPPRPGDDVAADRTIRQAVTDAFTAQTKLRENIRHEPGFAGVICRALGCEHPDCLAPMRSIEERITQIPKVVSVALGGSSQVLPLPFD